MKRIISSHEIMSGKHVDDNNVSFMSLLETPLVLKSINSGMDISMVYFYSELVSKTVMPLTPMNLEFYEYLRRVVMNIKWVIHESEVYLSNMTNEMVTDKFYGTLTASGGNYRFAVGFSRGVKGTLAHYHELGAIEGSMVDINPAVFDRAAILITDKVVFDRSQG